MESGFMGHELSIAVIHGMGSQQRGFSRPLKDEVNAILGPAKSRQVKWGEIHWADVLEPRQRAYFRRANSKNDLDFVSLRRFVISALSDAVAYRKTADTKDTVYQDIHRRVKVAIRGLDDPTGPPRPLIVLAHSLGGHIMSNYIYDMQKSGSRVAAGLNDFQKMKSLAGLITFGCNIPLFTFAYDKKNIRPIKFPGSKLSAAHKQRARWLNFYDPDDILAYPLKPINKAYRDVVNRDIPINVGSVLFSWNPGAHGKYWTDNDFNEPVARFVGGFL